MSLTTISSGANATVAVTAQQYLLLSNDKSSVARVEYTSGTESGKIIEWSHNGRQVYGPLAAANVKVSAVSGDVAYEVGDNKDTLDVTSWYGNGPTTCSSHLGTVANEAAMVALTTAVVGSMVTRTDTGTVWILKAAPYSTAGNWQDTGAGSGAWGGITGTLADQTDLDAALDAKADALAAVVLTGNTTLTRTSHYNRPIIVNSAGAVSLAVTGTDALVGDYIDVMVKGGGSATLTGITPVTGYTLDAASGGSVQAACVTDAAMVPSTKTWQETLVSATNIKTVNGTSLLGSGDVVVGGSSWLAAGPSTAVLPSPQTSTTAMQYVGVTSAAYALTGTASNTGLDMSVARACRPWTVYTAAAAIDAGASMAQSNALPFGFSVDAPNWVAELMFSVEDALTTGRMQVGVCSAMFGSGNEPTATFQGNGIWLGCNSGDTQMKIYMRRTGGDVATTVVLNGGSGFPAHDNTKIFHVRFVYNNGADGSTRRVDWTAKNVTDNISVSGSWDGTGGTPAMPTGNIAGATQWKRGTASGVNAAPALRFYGAVSGKFAG